MTGTRKIGVVQLARFGDLVQTTPFLQRLREQEPGASISIIVDRRVEAVANLLDDVDEVIGVDLAGIPAHLTGTILADYENLRAWVKSWRRDTDYDRLILLNHGAIPEAVASFLGAERREGPGRGSAFDRPHRLLRAALSNRAFIPLHLSEVWAAYGPRKFPVPAPKIKPVKSGTTFAFLDGKGHVRDNKNKVFAVNLGAGAAGRRMSTENLAALVRTLVNGNPYRLVAVGTDDDRQTAARLMQSVPLNNRNRVIDLTGNTTLEQLTGVLEAVDVLISADTGTLQLAAAAGTASVGLFFANANPIETGAYSPGAVAVVRRDTLRPGPQPSAGDMVLAAKVATRLVQGQPLEDLEDESDTCFVLVARSAPVGVEYEPLRPGSKGNLGQGGRWLPLLRQFLWAGDRIGETVPGSRKAWTDLFGSEDALRLRDLHDQIVQNGGKQLESWDEETRWLAHIVAEFPNETALWTAQMLASKAGRIHA